MNKVSERILKLIRSRDQLSVLTKTDIVLYDTLEDAMREINSLENQIEILIEEMEGDGV